MPESESTSLLLAAIAIVGEVFLHHDSFALSLDEQTHAAIDVLVIFLAITFVISLVKRLRAKKVSLSSSLAVCDAVTFALRNQLSMAEVIEKLPMDQQLEAVRFMEYLDKTEKETPPH